MSVGVIIMQSFQKNILLTAASDFLRVTTALFVKGDPYNFNDTSFTCPTFKVWPPSLWDGRLGCKRVV